MAEFIEVMRQRKRMCRAQTNCTECPIEKSVGFCVVLHEDNEALEKVIMDWAQAHPEQVYPTWYDWQKENFPDNTRYICPMAFGVTCPAPSAPGVTICKKCRNKPIPAEIAERLGIKPIGKKNERR